MAHLFTKKRSLEQATIDGDINEVRLILKTPGSFQGMDINNALLKAAYKNQDKIMKILLDHGADVTKRDKFQNCTALMIAVQKGFSSCVDLLLNYSPRINENDISLTMALESKCSNIAKILIDQGANINVTNKHGETTLLMAADGVMGNIIKRLIKMGMNVHAIDPRDNSTALHKLLHNLKAETLDFDILEAIIGLIGMGIDVNKRDKDGRTPLMISMTNDFSRINKPNVQAPNENLQYCMAQTFKIFLSKCSHLNDGDNNGITPLMLAADNGYEHHVKALLKLGCHINQLTIDQWSALRFAVKSGHTSIVKLLLEHGANPNLGNDQGTIFEEALYKCVRIKEIIQLLQFHGCKVDLKPVYRNHMYERDEMQFLTDMYRYGNCSSQSITHWINSPEFAYQWHHNRAKTSWLLRMCSKPRSLLSSTRITIRQYTRNIDSLPIPQKLKQYLNYEWDPDVFDQQNEELILQSDATSPKPDSKLVQKAIEKREHDKQRQEWGAWIDQNGYI